MLKVGDKVLITTCILDLHPELGFRNSRLGEIAEVDYDSILYPYKIYIEGTDRITWGEAILLTDLLKALV